jgi:general secretion pathway protein K
MNRNASALLLTLWLTMALALLVSVFAYSVNQEIEWTSWHRKKDEAGVLAKSALQFLPKLIDDQRKEAAYSGKPPANPFDPEKFAGYWQSQDFALGRGTFHLTVRDVEQKINVNTAPPELWENFLRFTKLSDNDTRAWIDSLTDWTDSNDASRLNGAEDEFYSRLSPPYRAKNAPITTLGELLWVRKGPEVLSAQLDPDVTGRADRVLDYLTVEGDGKINVNTAPLVVLASLGHIDIGTAEKWVKERNGPDGIAGTPDDAPIDSQIFGAGDTNGLVTTQSDYFIVEGIGDVGGVRASRRGLFHNDGGQLKKIKDLVEQDS